MDSKHTDSLLTIKETAQLLKVSEKTLRRWEQVGIFSSIRTPGGHRRYPLGYIKKFKRNGHTKVTRLIDVISANDHTEDYNLPEIKVDKNLDEPVRIDQNIPVRLDLEPIIAEQKRVIKVAGFFSLLILGFVAFSRPLGSYLASIHSPLGEKLIALTDTLRSKNSFGLRPIDEQSKNNLENAVLAATSFQDISFSVNVDSAINGNLTVSGNLAVNSGNVTSTSQTVNLFNTTSTAINMGGQATQVRIGATTGSTSINNNIDVNGTNNDIAGRLNLSGNSLTSTGDLVVNPGGGGVSIGTGTASSIDLTGSDLYITGDEEIDGTLYGTIARFSSDVTVSGATVLESTLRVSGATTLSSTLAVSGATTLSSSLTVAGETKLNGNTTLGDSTSDTITFTGGIAQDSDIIPITTSGTNDLGSSALPWDNIYAVAMFQDGNTVCDTSGNCLGGAGDLWINEDGAYHPRYSTVDLLIGGTATSSAKFAFINVNSGTPTASIAGNITLDSAGVIQTTKNQTLTLGGASTGNIVLQPSNGSGSTRFSYDGSNYLAVSLSSSGDATLDATGNDVVSSDRWTIGSTTAGVGKLNVTGAEIGKALVILNETDGQNIITASAAGITRMNLTTDGQLELLNDGSSAGITLGAGEDITMYHDGTNSFLLNTTGNLFLGGDSGSSGSQLQFGLENGSTILGYFITGSTNQGDFAVDTNTLYVDASANRIGIGNSAPNNTLDVTGTVEMTGLKLTTSPSSGYVLVSDSSGNGSWTDITTGGSAGAWTLSGSTLFPDLAAYNLLIGSISTSDDIGKLTVSGAKTGKALVVLNETGDQNILTASASGVTKLSIDRSGNITTVDNAWIGLGSGAGRFEFDDQTTDEINFLNTYVGIGTSTPGAELDVSGTIQTTAFRLTTGAASGYTLVSDGSGNGSWTDISSSGTAGPWTLSGTALFPDSTTYNLLLASTTAADAIGKLNVKGAATGKALVIFDETGDQNILAASSSGTTVFTMDHNGSISHLGKSATTDTYALSATSLTTANALDITTTHSPSSGGSQSVIDINITNNPSSSANTLYGLDLSMADSGTLANTLYGVYGLVNNSSNTSSGTHSIYGGYFSATGKTAGTTTAVGLYASASGADNNYAGIFENGYVGIGTTAPATIFEVKGAGSTNPKLIFDGDDAILKLTGNMNGGIDMPVIQFQDSVTSTLYSKIGYITNGGLGISSEPYPTTPSVFVEHGSDAYILRIVGGYYYGVSSRVGIGAAVPDTSARFSVLGATDLTNVFLLENNSGTNIFTVSNAGATDWILPAAGDIAIDATSVDNTTTSGVIDLNVNTVTNNNIGFNTDYQIKDSAGITGYANRINLTINTDADESSTGYGLYIAADNDDATSTAYGLFVDADGDGGGEGTEYAAAFMDGNVGVGTITPSTKIHAVGAQAANIIRVNADSSGAVNIGSGDTSVSGFFSWETPGGTRLGYMGFSATDVALNLENSADFVVNGGNTGIGDTSPDYLLELNAAASSDSSFVLSDGDVAHGLTDLVTETDNWFALRPISSTAGGAKLQAFSDTDASALNIYGYIGSTDPTDTTSAIKIIGAKKNTTNVQDLGSDETVFQVANNDNTPAITVTGSGAVGINETAPSSFYALDVTGALNVSTHIRLADQIALNINGSGQVAVGYSDGLAGVALYGSTTAQALTVDASGRVGIGDISPDFLLDVEKASATVAQFNRLTDDGTIISLAQGGTEEGTISVSDTTISYNAFTGSHYAWTDTPEMITRGTLVSLTGNNRRLHNNNDSEVIYGITPSSTVNDPSILGSYLSIQEPSREESVDNPSLVMAAGNGDVWIVQNTDGTSVSRGDYLISSDVRGHAMKDPQTFEVSHIFAKAAEDIDWNNVSETVVDPQGNLRKHTKITVFFEASKYSSTQSQGQETGAPATDQGITLDSIRALIIENQQPTASTSGWVDEVTTSNLFVTNQATVERLMTNKSIVVGQDLVLDSQVNQSTNQLSNSINSITSPLSLQSAGAQPLHIMAGLVRIDTNGNVDIAGDLRVGGNLTADSVKTNSIVLSANSTAGTTIVPVGQTEITIISTQVTQNSLIFITPIGTPTTGTLYIKEQLDGSFKVGITQSSEAEVKFNWMIVKTE